MNIHDGSKVARICVFLRGWSLRPLFLLLPLALLAGAFAVEAQSLDGSRGGPQTAEWSERNWGKAFGGVEVDEASAVAVTADGGFILAGRTLSFDEGLGYGDAWLLKLSPGGDVEWEKTYGDESWDALSSLRQMPDGGYVAAGNRTPPGESQEAWVMKLDSHGEVEWQNTYGRADHFDVALSVRPTTDGGLILLGWTQSFTPLGSRPGAWVLKLAESGEIEWQKFLGTGKQIDMLFSVEQTRDGGFVLAGGTYSYSDVPWFSDVWLVKMFPNGDVDWEKAYGGMYDDVAYSVKQDPEGGYVLACWTSFSAGDVWVMKTDSYGDLQWQKRYGGSRADVPTSLLMTADGGALVAGYTSSFGHGSDDGWVFKLTGDGRVRWQKTFGGEASDVFNEIVKTATGYAAVGYTNSFGAGLMDAWCIHFAPSGPGTVMLKSLTGSSHVVSPSMEVTGDFIDGLINDTDVQPVDSVTETRETFSTETVLSGLPGQGSPPPIEGRDIPPGANSTWPLAPRKGLK